MHKVFSAKSELGKGGPQFESRNPFSFYDQHLEIINIKFTFSIKGMAYKHHARDEMELTHKPILLKGS